jgi:uncharacterized protein YecE (DUF72 family)
MPRTITHELKLQDAREPLVAFLSQTDGLAQKRGPLLMQLPPSLPFHTSVVDKFLQLVRNLYDGIVVCEPRHATWFSSSATALLVHYRISRVAVDPSALPAAAVPAGWPGVAYFRLHGSPRKYWSKYDDHYLARLAETVQTTATAEGVWCVFDNTASGAALENACELRALLTTPNEPAPPSIETAGGIALMPRKRQPQRRKLARLCGRRKDLE